MTKEFIVPQGILWDLDNTLYRLDHALEHTVNVAVAKAAINLGADIELEEAIKLALYSWQQHRFSGQEFVIRYGLDHRDIHFEMDRTMGKVLIEKCMDTCDLLARSKSAHALITHASRNWAMNTLRHLELKTYFPDERIFAFEDFEFESKAKSRRSFEEALASIDRAPEHSMMVEDTVINLRVPHEMGMTTIVLHHGQPLDEYPDYVDFAFANSRELLMHIEAVGQAIPGASKASA